MFSRIALWVSRKTIAVTKMNKLLFYADFIHYKNHGYGINSITYKALPFGPVPEHWGTLYSSLPGIDMEEFEVPTPLYLIMTLLL